MMVCVRLITGEGEGRDRERGTRDKRSVDRLIQSNLGDREGTAMLEIKRGTQRSLRLPTPPKHSKRSSQPSFFHSDYNRDN